MPDKPRKTLQTNIIPAVKDGEDALPATGVGWPEERPIPQGAMDAMEDICALQQKRMNGAFEIDQPTAREMIARIIAAHTIDPAELARVTKQRDELAEVCEQLRKCLLSLQDHSFALSRHMVDNLNYVLGRAETAIANAEKGPNDD